MRRFLLASVAALAAVCAVRSNIETRPIPSPIVTFWGVAKK
jgi:hypothetical protein